MNASGGVNQRCVSAATTALRAGEGDAASDCYFAQHVLPYVQTPVHFEMTPGLVKFESTPLAFIKRAGRNLD